MGALVCTSLLLAVLLPFKPDALGGEGVR